MARENPGSGPFSLYSHPPKCPRTDGRCRTRVHAAQHLAHGRRWVHRLHHRSAASPQVPRLQGLFRACLQNIYSCPKRTHTSTQARALPVTGGLCVGETGREQCAGAQCGAHCWQVVVLDKLAYCASELNFSAAARPRPPPPRGTWHLTVRRSAGGKQGGPQSVTVWRCWNKSAPLCFEGCASDSQTVPAKRIACTGQD